MVKSHHDRRVRALFRRYLWIRLLSLTQALSSTGIPITTRPFRVYYDASNHWHRDIGFHYEIPERITSCVRSIEAFQQERRDLSVELVDISPEHADLGADAPSATVDKLWEPCSDDELTHARQVLLQTHHKDLITSLEEKCRTSKERRILEGKPALGHIGYIDSGDTFVTTETFDVCLRATAAWIRAVDSSEPNGRITMALTRPPGHHATFHLQNGFCLYNFAAAAALHAQTYRGLAKISILDWDVHYGQGVADIVARHEGIRYVSIHQSPTFPYEGQTKQREDNVLTLPMPPDTSWTCGYADLFETALQFCAVQGEWEPDLVIVCAGYDAISNDALASVSLDAADYGQMSQRLRQHLSESCENPPRIMLGLEGGYHLGHPGSSGNLPSAVVETIRAMVEQTYR